MNAHNFPLPAALGLLPAALALLLTLAATPLAATAAAPAKVEMAPFKAAFKDKPSLQRGAQLFVNYCLSCHSAKFMRYSRMAEDLEIPADIVERNLLFAADKIGDPMEVTMDAKSAEAWFGVAPPDLSLSGRLRGGEWLYNYLLTFYVDETAASGWNNAVFENVAMPHALYELQGMRRAVFKTAAGADGKPREVLDYFEPITAGVMSDEEYAQAAYDLANFLVYVGEPARAARYAYGFWVLLFLLVFAALAWALKKEYWRDIK